LVSEISGSHGVEYEDDSSGKLRRVFPQNEAVVSEAFIASETSVNFCENTRRNIPEVILTAS
jgi:hypothetical protein